MFSSQRAPADDMSASVGSLIDVLKGAGTELSGAKDCEVTIQQTLQHLCSLLTSIDILRVEAHDKLEAESIAASNLRYKLTTLQKSFEAELADLTVETKRQIAQEKRKKQSLIADVRATKAQVCLKQSQLNDANKNLAIELEKCNMKYKELIGHVNDTITDRARVKIVLNETQEQLNSVQTRIQECKSDISRAQEKSDDAKREFLVEMDQISTSLKEIKILAEAESVKKRDLSMKCDDLQKDVIKAKSATEQAKMSYTEAEARLMSEKELHRMLDVAIVKASEHAEYLLKECGDIKEMAVSERKSILSEKEELMKQHSLMMGAVDELKAEVDILLNKQSTVQAALVKEMKLKDKYQSSVLSIKKRSAMAKETLKLQSEQGADMKMQNRQMESQLKSCRENFNVVSVQLKDVLEKLESEFEGKEFCRLSLEKETQILEERIHTLNNELKKMTQELESAQAENITFCDSSKESISVLEHASKSYTQEIELLRKEESEHRRNLHSYTDEMQKKMQDLKNNIKDLQKNIAEKLFIIEVLEPECSKLQHDHDELSVNYEDEKECIIGMKNHRTTLRESAERSNKKLRDTAEKQEELRMEIIHERTKTKDHFETQTQTTNTTEIKVADTKHHLEAIVRENARLQAVMEEMKREYQWMRNQLGKPSLHTDTQMDEVRENLTLSWQKDEEVHQEQKVHSEGLLSKTLNLSTDIKRRLQGLDYETICKQ